MGNVRFLLRVLAIVVVMVLGKFVVHAFAWEAISLNALFTGIIAANVFLMGFLLSGVLSDYKEAEKMPGEVSACLENMCQEVLAMRVAKPEAPIGSAIAALSKLAGDIDTWFHRKLDTEGLVASINRLTVEFSALEPASAATWVSRLKSEQSTLRRTMTRIEVIRDTSFVSTGYMLASLITFLLCLGLVFVNMDPFYENVITSSVIAFLLAFMLLLIRDLDDPFGYGEEFSSADVALFPVANSVRRIAAIDAEINGEPVATALGAAANGHAAQAGATAVSGSQTMPLAAVAAAAAAAAVAAVAAVTQTAPIAPAAAAPAQPQNGRAGRGVASR